MHWFVTDETNVERNQGDFFIYGGLVLTDDQMVGLHEAVRDIRARYGYAPGDTFKFAANTRPSQVSIEEARQAKQDALLAAEGLGVRLIVYVVLHAIAGSDQRVRMQFAINTVMWTYHTLLVQEGATGSSALIVSMTTTRSITSNRSSSTASICQVGSSGWMIESCTTACRPTMRHTSVPS
jgi:hypothetical protein